MASCTSRWQYSPTGTSETVEPLGELTVRPDPNQEGIWLCPSSEAPYTTYVTETANLRLEVDVQCRLGVDSTVSPTTSGLFSWAASNTLDPVPRPHTGFTWMRDGYGLRLCSVDTGGVLRPGCEHHPHGRGQ